MKKLILNVFIFSFPLLICLGFFVVDDPFAVLHKTTGLVESSEDVVKTRWYLENWQHENYSAFVFGNSRVHGFSEDDIKSHMGEQNIFYFGSPGESTLNIRKKISMILERQKMNNALLLIDERILKNTDNEDSFYQGPVYNHCPQTSNVSHIEFYSNYMRYYFSDLFFLKHIYFKITGNYIQDWMKNTFAEPKHETAAVRSKFPSLADSLIETNFSLYKKTFQPDYSPNRELLIEMSQIDQNNLIQVKALLEKGKVQYKVLISPDFMSNGMRRSLSKQLYNIFGANLYDLSNFKRVNTDSTLNYENLHFTLKAGKIILDSIYGIVKK